MAGLRTLLAATALVASPAYAGEARIDVPAGRVDDAAVAIARATGASIVIADPVLSARRIGPVRGRYSAREAAEVLARAAGARLVSAGPNAWRLVSAPQAAPRPRPAARPPRPEPVAQPPETVGAQDIVIIGSKRDLRLRDFAGQFNLVDGEDLTFGGVGGTDKLAARIASLSTTHLGSGRNKLFIRGIADSSFTGPTQSTVGLYLGDLRLSYNAPDPDLRLSDLASVEVLEGPQGTLYGAGALGGIIRLVPNAPDFGGFAASGQVGASMTAHGKPGIDGSIAINAPLAENLALRVSADGEVQGGYIDKPLLGRRDVNRTEIGSGRATLRWEAGGGWTVDLVGVAQRTDGRDSQYADRDGPRLTRLSQVPEGYRADYAQGQLVVSGELGQVQLKSTTGIAWQELSERYDATAPGGEARLFTQANRTRMIANETRAWMPLEDRFGWVLGVSYTHNRTRLTRALGPLNMPAKTTGVSNVIDELTLYGEASYRLAPGLIASAGGRFTRSSIGGAGEDVAPLIALARADVTAQRRERMFLPSGSLVADLGSTSSLYLRYQQGFRPGGLAIDGDFVRRFRGDRIRTFEFGGRHGRPGRGPFDLAASVSYTDWQDIQADFIDGAGLPTTANVGDGKIWTFSLAGSVAATPSLRLDAGVVYNHSRISQPSLFLALTRLAQLAPITEVPNVAKLAVRGGFDWRRPVSGELELKVQGWVRYVGKSRLGVGPELGELQGDYLDSGLTARIGRDGLGVTLGVSNLADTAGNRFALGTPFAIGRDQITPLRPLTVRLGFDAWF